MYVHHRQSSSRRNGNHKKTAPSDPIMHRRQRAVVRGKLGKGKKKNTPHTAHTERKTLSLMAQSCFFSSSFQPNETLPPLTLWKQAAFDSLSCQTHKNTRTHTHASDWGNDLAREKETEARTVHYGSLSRAPITMPWPHVQCSATGHKVQARHSFTENYATMRSTPVN